MIRRLAAVVSCALLPAGCVAAYQWQEVASGPSSRGEVYMAVDQVARAHGFVPGTGCDQGLGTWESRWKHLSMELGRPSRLRLHAEVLIDEGDAAAGWPVRYWIERQKVDDLRRSLDPRETDWEADGQDGEREFLFGEALRLKLGVSTYVEPTDR